MTSPSPRTFTSGLSGSGKEAASLRLPPLRSVRATFTAHGSSKPDPYVVRWSPMDLGLRLLA